MKIKPGSVLLLLNNKKVSPNFCSWFYNVASASRLFEFHVAGKMRQIAWKAGLTAKNYFVLDKNLHKYCRQFNETTHGPCQPSILLYGR